MMSSETTVAAVIGAVSFFTYFHHGEHHLLAARYLNILILTCAISTVYLTRMQGHALNEALLTTLKTSTSFLFGLYTTCILYRISPLHPLSKFPGPFGARITGFWLVFQVVPKRQAHLAILRAHETYGPIVRVGPNDLSIVHPKAVERVHNTCLKAPFYDTNTPVVTLQTTRDKAMHDRYRKVWSTAFTESRLRGYEPRIKRTHRHLLARIDEDSKGRDPRPIDATRLISYYAFDAMGEVAFGSSFDMLTTNKSHEAVDMMKDYMGTLGFMLPVWLLRLLFRAPGLSRRWNKFVEYCFEQIEICRLSKPDSSVIASTLVKQFEKREPTPFDTLVLKGEAQLLVVAGSDTTSGALTCALYALVRHPHVLEKLRKALATVLPPGTKDINANQVRNIDFLNGIINETLRMYPVALTTLWRKTPAQGLWIDDETYIPGNVVVSTPQYVLGRSAEIYDRPDEFIPERWYSKPEMIKQEKAFAPFGIGSFSCVGRPLALMNLRMTLAQLVHTYDISLPASISMEEARVAMEGSMQDNFTMMPGQLMLVFKRRNIE